MSSDFALVTPQGGWEFDLASVYSAYMGHFQLHGTPWYDRSWGRIFESLQHFLEFVWPCITVTDRHTGRAHIVTRQSSINAFIKTVKTRFGENLPVIDNFLVVDAFETTQRPLRNVSDLSSYKKLHATLPAVSLAANKLRIRSGEPKAVRELWAKRDSTLVAMNFKWSERNKASCMEWGYAALRCGHLDSLGVWPPKPDENYRKGHYIVSEYTDTHNKNSPTFPWRYAFGESQVVAKSKLPNIIEAIISSLASPESDAVPNNLVLVAHGLGEDLSRLEDMRIKLPHNVFIVDTATLERSLFSAGERGPMLDAKKGYPRAAKTSLSLESLLHSMNVDPPCTMNNSGNDAFMILVALQKLMDPANTILPVGQRKVRAPHIFGGVATNRMSVAISPAGVPFPMHSPGMLSPMSTGFFPPIRKTQSTGSAVSYGQILPPGYDSHTRTASGFSNNRHSIGLAPSTRRWKEGREETDPTRRMSAGMEGLRF